MKITIELDEGVKYTVEQQISEELMLVSNRKGHPDGGKRVKDIMIQMATHGAQKAIQTIMKTIDDHTLVYQYNEILGGKVSKRGAYPIKDINEFMEFRYNLLKTQTRELLEENLFPIKITTTTSDAQPLKKGNK